MIRYMVHTGWVTSKTDGDEHFVGARDLMHLYGVKPGECIVHHHGLPNTHLRGISPERFASLIHLYPDATGQYRLTPDSTPA